MSLDRTTENDLVRRALEALSRGVSDPDELGLGPYVVDINDVDVDDDALEEVVVDPDDWDPTERNMGVVAALSHLSAANQRRGIHILPPIVDERQAPRWLTEAAGKENMSPAEYREWVSGHFQEEWAAFQDSIARACGGCSLREVCLLVDQPDEFARVYGDKPARDVLRRSLEANPFGLCEPPDYRDVLKATERHPSGPSERLSAVSRSDPRVAVVEDEPAILEGDQSLPGDRSPVDAARRTLAAVKPYQPPEAHASPEAS